MIYNQNNKLVDNGSFQNFPVWFDWVPKLHKMVKASSSVRRVPEGEKICNNGSKQWDWTLGCEMGCKERCICVSYLSKLEERDLGYLDDKEINGESGC